MAGINNETARKMLVEDVEHKVMCTRFVLHLLTPTQKHQRIASCEGFVKVIDEDRNVFKGL
jgi:hypothetical protein